MHVTRILFGFVFILTTFGAHADESQVWSTIQQHYQNHIQRVEQCKVHLKNVVEASYTKNTNAESNNVAVFVQDEKQANQRINQVDPSLLFGIGFWNASTLQQFRKDCNSDTFLRWQEIVNTANDCAPTMRYTEYSEALTRAVVDQGWSKKTKEKAKASLLQSIDFISKEAMEALDLYAAYNVITHLATTNVIAAKYDQRAKDSTKRLTQKLSAIFQDTKDSMTEDDYQLLQEKEASLSKEAFEKDPEVLRISRKIACDGMLPRVVREKEAILEFRKDLQKLYQELED